MGEVSSELVVSFGVALAVYMPLMYAIGYWAQRRISSVDDYVVAGRRLPLSLTTLTIVATWFGAESLMTTADEVSGQGIRRAMLDPIGISLCLVITGLFIAGPMWRLNLLTIPDFFRGRYGKRAEIFASLILVPSYFGWIAAQYYALALLVSQIFSLPLAPCIVGAAILGTGYALMGGMISITWTDAIQMVFIVVGLGILGYEILHAVGDGQTALAWNRLRSDIPAGHWRLADDETFLRDWLAALSALTIGSLGNLPVQDLIQRIFSARTSRTATAACLIGAAGYLALGLLPITAGLAASLLLDSVPEEGVLTMIAHKLLSGPLLIVFLLAIVSAILSTIVSAVMAPAAVLAHNLIEPYAVSRGKSISAVQSLALQRGSVVVVAACSMLLALSGQGAYELVQASYAMSLVGMLVPFVCGLWCRRIPPRAGLPSMVIGIAAWSVHVAMGWEYFAGSDVPIPHELVDTLLSGLVFGGVWLLARQHDSGSPEQPKTLENQPPLNRPSAS